MTSTNLYSGYDQGRPTSKVMAPPGGASSNIFGTDPSYAPKQEKVQQEQESSNNRLFGGDAPDQNPITYEAPSDSKVTSAAAGVNTHAGKSRNHASSVEEEDDSAGMTQCRKRFFKHEGRDGDEEETEEERKKREEEEAKKKALEKASSPARATGPRGAYNPITGEDYPDKASQAPAPRVRQPPGGKSSGLW